MEFEYAPPPRRRPVVCYASLTRWIWMRVLGGGSQQAPVEFEKDDDAHMLLITATSNLRARNYRIPEVREGWQPTTPVGSGVLTHHCGCV